uniref:Uncharacterized protein n=1 Tax=Megaselia scalaris TaxID=36166 RepID=T1H3V0_MEGSC
MVCSFDTLYNAVQPQYTLEVRTGN